MTHVTGAGERECPRRAGRLPVRHGFHARAHTDRYLPEESQ
ncbi:predicted protein [Streptomyces viridosporus ATCC 14672]|uniref:Predicted protein n=1 Tax=Streptomyces viridosporus (strain ATCC 14672 / DSM 40746 / JCM 4963 / KCTC 9882 / NRRL B-12104 / FH 1290) TaxID=566461 RepID=D5ZUQ1_STRV1|nr:predicted protein [Streptomyces viridosporus ATCC 14672]